MSAKRESGNVRFQKPPVDSFITLTTRYADYYAYRTSNFRETTYENVQVLAPERWFGPLDIKISSDDPKQAYRVINMKNVVALSDGIRDTNSSSFVINVEGSKGTVYPVTMHDGVPVSCTCKGFQFRSTCRHLSIAVDNLKELQDNPAMGQ